MNFLMTASAQCDEIGFGIVAEFTARDDMVNLEVNEASAILAPPPLRKDKVDTFVSNQSWSDCCPDKRSKIFGRCTT
jgi:hypothetical protein